MKYEKGGITVFLSMSLVIIMSLIFSLIETVHIYGLKEYTNIAAELGIESMFAQYNRILWEDYGILAIDGGFGREQLNLDRLQNKMGEYAIVNANPSVDRKSSKVSFFNSNLEECKIVSYTLITDNGGVGVIKEAAKNMTYSIPEEIKNNILSNVSTMKNDHNNTTDIEELLEQGEIAINESSPNTIAENRDDDIDIEAVEVEENPIKVIKEWKANGVLSQVISDIDSVSNQSFHDKSRVSKRVLNTGTSGEVYSISALDKALFGMYLKTKVQNYTKSLNHGGLKYEWEYVIAGKENDKENLESVVERLLAIREAENLISITADSVKTSQALSIAVGLAGITANPAIVEAVKWGIIAAWAYIESVLDVRLLLSGGKVSLVKSPAEWTSQITNISTYVNPEITAKECVSGMGYDEYLLGMTFMSSSNKLGLKFLDILEDSLNANQYYEMSRMDNMICSANVEFRFSSRAIFLSVIPNGMKRIGGYAMNKKMSLSYL